MLYPAATRLDTGGMAPRLALGAEKSGATEPAGRLADALARASAPCAAVALIGRGER